MNKTLIDSAVLIPKLSASDRDAALDEILGALVDDGCLAASSRATVHGQLLEREAQGSTGLGNGVAVPHVKETDVERMVIAVALAEPGIGFDAIDGRPVQILFMVLGPRGGAPEEHLAVLRWVSSLARNADFRRFARQADSDAAIRDLLVEMTDEA